ncbi:YheC/YheD family protein [Paenibacillus sp.]|uniref:YheC/YheD family endospore coat-associated protein n=1 Tax=Paenibacillus sp. TaxID=58172 RepID=UPI0028112EAF|nr:YheC/YheD family protein [Paenibacillus sp.]
MDLQTHHLNAQTKNSPAPVAAILTYRDGTRIFRGNRDNFIDLLRTAKEEGVTAYIVAQDDLDLRARKLKGYVYSASKRKWVLGERPFPDIVYNRIPYRKFEQLPEVQEVIRGCLSHPTIRFFNPSFFSKWSLFEWLKESKLTRGHIPETVRLTGLGDFARMVRKYRNVYLKPVKGKAGKGIMKVQQLSGKRRSAEGGYRLTCQSGDGVESTTFDTVSAMYDAVKRHMDGKEYIAQQGISLAVAGGRPFDLRALVQKNDRGEWRVSGIGARVAGASSITTHVPRGGSIGDPSKLLGTVFGPTSGRSILRQARETALVLASQIEKGSGHTLGEMSMDLGVDTTGKLWFFEANSKPMKFDEPHIREKSLRRLVRFWKYLVASSGDQPRLAKSLRRMRRVGRGPAKRRNR